MYANSDILLSTSRRVEITGISRKIGGNKIMSKLSVGKVMLKLVKACGRRIFWFAEATKQMFADYAATIREYRSCSSKKKKAIKRKALWLAGYVMIHAVITAAGCVISAFGFVAMLCYEGTDLITGFQSFVLCAVWLCGLMLALYGVLSFDWEIVSHARRRRNVCVKMKRLKRQALKRC